MDRFTGGDNFTGLKHIMHKLMMLNELNNGQNAYQLSHAKCGNSGYSFGGNQMDLLANPEAKKYLYDILTHNNIEQQQLDNIIKKVTTKDCSLTENEIAQVNQALKSDYGKECLNKAYQQEIEERIKYIDKIIATSHPKVKAIAEKSAFIKAMLFDYHNQFHITKNGSGMHKLLKGELDLTDINEKNLIKQIRGFTKKTKYYIDDKRQIKDLDRRYKNLVSLFNSQSAINC